MDAFVIGDVSFNKEFKCNWTPDAGRTVRTLLAASVERLSSVFNRLSELVQITDVWSLVARLSLEFGYTRHGRCAFTRAASDRHSGLGKPHVECLATIAVKVVHLSRPEVI